MPLKPKFERMKQEFIKKHGKEDGTRRFFALVEKGNLEVEQKAYVVISEELKALDPENPSGVFATGDRDSYGDILTDSCLEDMAEQLRTLPITIDLDHESFQNKNEGEKARALIPIAKVTSVQKTGNKIEVKTTLNKAHRGFEDVKSSIKNKFLHSFSFAFHPIEFTHRMVDGLKSRIIDKVTLLNGCFTGIPVNINSRLGDVMLKSLDDFNYSSDETDKILGGLLMTDENENKGTDDKPEGGDKGEDKGEGDSGDNPDKGTETKEAELKAEKEAKEAELKSMIEKIHEPIKKELEELKSKVEADAKTYAVAEELKSALDMVKEHEKILSEPVFKARSEQMKKILDKQEEVKSKKDSAEKGPLDKIQ